jgi:hypothetical protein
MPNPVEPFLFLSGAVQKSSASAVGKVGEGAALAGETLYKRDLKVRLASGVEALLTRDTGSLFHLILYHLLLLVCPTSPFRKRELTAPQRPTIHHHVPPRPALPPPRHPAQQDRTIHGTRLRSNLLWLLWFPRDLRHEWAADLVVQDKRDVGYVPRVGDAGAVEGVLSVAVFVLVAADDYSGGEG